MTWICLEVLLLASDVLSINKNTIMVHETKTLYSVSKGKFFMEKSENQSLMGLRRILL